jgi:hypothetical protein
MSASGQCFPRGRGHARLRCELAGLLGNPAVLRCWAAALPRPVAALASAVALAATGACRSNGVI